MSRLTTIIAILTASIAHAQLTPIRYDDCGESGRQPHVVNGALYEFAESFVSAPLAARTVAFEASAVRVRYENLAPDATYAARVTYSTERNGARTQRMTAEGAEIHGALDLPQGEAKTFDYDLPANVAADGAIELSFEHVTGPNAVVSEVWLLSDQDQPELSIALDSDLRGGLTVTAQDALLQPVPDATVVATMPGIDDITATTGASGSAQIGLTALPAEGGLTVTVASGDLAAIATAPVGSLFFRRPVLTPVPYDVTGPRTHPIRLSGTWRFAPTLPDGFERPDFDDSDWSDITVPGEWVMQGFTVEPGKPAGFRTSFKAPKSWRRRAVKIRFDAVYSICDVYLNGQHVGSHEGGFTPFEVDITSTVIPGKPNTLALAVTSESTADTMASASTYARHPLGGIARKVTAFAVPKVHLTRFHADTDLDADYEDATLTILAEVAGPTDGVELRVDLRHPTGMMEEIGQCSVPTDGTVTMVADVRAPELWDSEHPNLYTLWGLLKVNGKVKEFVTRRIGFREVEVRGNQLFVNGDVVKLRGVCRHEVHPDLGRSMTHKIWTRDIELLKGANVNYVRTAHYPPAEEFISRCDKAGIYVQDEGPWCWASASAANSPETLGLVMRSNAEMIERDRSHPSVIIWDIANESNWGSNYARANDYIHAEDPSRPTLFSYQPDPSPTDIITWHYPGIDGPARAADSDKPITFDEYCHLNCYNPAEVEADPGLRDYWGHALEDMWNAMYESQGVLGGAIWCWCDDVFDLPTGRAGYGEWGPVDGFRRPKPEWWHVRKVYSPIHIRVDRLEPGQVFIPIQNRYNHTNLSEIECRWRLGEGSGTLHLDVPPGGTGVLPFLIKSPEHDALHLTFIDPSDRLVDEYAIPVGPRTTPALDALSREAPDVDGISIILTEQESGREVTLEGDITSTATEITYTATYSGDPITVREVGLKLTLAGGLQNLSWRRIGQWSVYPDDHIGRLTGETAAFPVAEGDPRPESWSQDHDPRGCNDFRSTKYSITRASLTDDSGAGVGVVSDGRHSIRASVEGDAVVLRICEFSNGGGERFLRGHYAADYRTIDPGDVIAGAVLLHLVQPR